MKNRIAFLFVIFAIGLLLSACTGLQMASSWPGLAGQEDSVIIAYGGGVLAVSTGDGSQLWKIPEKADPANQYFATPSFLNGQVLVGDYTNTLHSLDKSTGAEKWAFSEAKGRFIAGAVPAGNLVLAPSVDDTLYALNKDGRVVWKFPAKNDIWAAPVSDGKTVYVAGMDRMLYALSLSDGSLIWSVDLGAAILSAPALSADRKLYIATLGKQVLAVDATDGSILWTCPTEGTLWSSPVIKDKTIYIGDIEKKAYAIDAKSGEILWKVELPAAIYGSAAVMQNGLAFGTDAGDLVALSFKGEKLWSQRINGKLYTTPVVVGEKLYVAVKDSEKILLAYDFNGKELWSVAVPK